MADERKDQPSGKAGAKQAREARLAAALRANLRRRKDAARRDRPAAASGRDPGREARKP